MRPLEETPILKKDQRQLRDVLISIDKFGMAFTILVDQEGRLDGIISNADVRKGLIKNLDDLNNIVVENIVNLQPVYINENATVLELLRHIKSKSIPITYLPVINNKKIVTGCVTFINLIKGEL